MGFSKWSKMSERGLLLLLHLSLETHIFISPFPTLEAFKLLLHLRFYLKSTAEISRHMTHFDQRLLRHLSLATHELLLLLLDVMFYYWDKTILFIFLVKPKYRQNHSDCYFSTDANELLIFTSFFGSLLSNFEGRLCFGR